MKLSTTRTIAILATSVSLCLALVCAATASAQSLAEALDDTLVWSTGGNASWYGQTSYTHDGTDAAGSDYISHYQETWIETTVTGPGTIWFWWKVSSEADFDFLTFIVDGVTNAAISGEVNWEQRTNHVSEGTHTFRWRYAKDKALSAGQDRGFLDQVDFITPAAVIVTNPQGVHQRQGSTVMLNVGATGDFLTYQWRRNGQTVAGGTNATLVLSNALASQSGAYDVLVTNMHNAATSTVANVDIYVALPMPTRSTNAGLVVGWGNNYYGQLNAPADLTNAVAVAAGADGFSVGLKSDGTVVAWGDSWGCKTCVPNLTNVVAIAAGSLHTLALMSDGMVAAWGYNDQCQTCVPSGLSNVVAIAAGYRHSLALRDDGTVVGWGLNEYGQAHVDPNLTDAVAIAAGHDFSLVLRRNGTVVAWGRNHVGQTNVPANLQNIAAISVGSGYYTSVGLRTDGTVTAWGYNWNNITNVPVGVQNVTKVAAGTDFVTALKKDGTITTWGASAPPVPSTSNNFVAIAAGNNHVLAIVTIPLLGPTDAAVPEGGTASFNVQPQGPGNFTCQWFFNGVALTGATNFTLTLTNITLANAGSYTAKVWTDQRQALSRPAKLIVMPRNDSFAQRSVATGGGGRFYNSTVNASSEPGEPNHANAYGNRSIWYEWTAPVNGSVSVDTIGSTFDTVLAVYTGEDFANLALLASDDDGANFNGASRVDFACTAGVSYLIAVDGFLGASGGVVLNVIPALSIPEARLAGSTSLDLTIFAPSGKSVILEGTTDFQTWTPVCTNPAPANGLLQVTRPAAGRSVQFFRARVNGQP